MMDKQQELHALLTKTIDEQVEHKVAKIKNENKELRAAVYKLQDKVLALVDERDAARNEAKDAKVLLELVEVFKARLDNIQDKAVRSEFVYNLLKLFFEPDFEENTYDCPTWLGAVVNFYSHRDIVIRLLKALEIYVPDNVDNFRLPHEWTTDELDIFFDTMNKHYVCNNCIYEDNLRFWKPNALSTVYDVCYNSGSYTEIPWQFVLRNPNLLNEKYLKKIGKMAFGAYNEHWIYFFKIQKYQELTPEQIKLIITNMNEYHTFNSKCYTSVNEFLMKNAEHFPEGPLLNSFYKCFNDSYDFKYNNIVLKLPVKYIEDWIKRIQNPLEWIERNKNKLNEEQRKTLLKIVMEEYLGGTVV